MKKLTALFLALLSLLALVSCDIQTNGYSATRLLKSEGGDGCKVSFGSLTGTLVLNATVPADTDGTIHYDAELDTGELSVYYAIDGQKQLLFTLKGGGRADSRGGRVAKGDKVTIIIETNGKTQHGDIEIDFE